MEGVRDVWASCVVQGLPAQREGRKGDAGQQENLLASFERALFPAVVLAQSPSPLPLLLSSASRTSSIRAALIQHPLSPSTSLTPPPPEPFTLTHLLARLRPRAPLSYPNPPLSRALSLSFLHTTFPHPTRPTLDALFLPPLFFNSPTPPNSTHTQNALLFLILDGRPRPRLYPLRLCRLKRWWCVPRLFLLPSSSAPLPRARC
jgi:hypothetical protein